ncbi:MAG: hypothetical protein U0350_03265 [Caldilineaceae bacterium]
MSIDSVAFAETANFSQPEEDKENIASILDFGALPRGRTQIQRFQIESPEKTDAECKITYSEQNAWFRVIAMNSVVKASVFPLNIIVEVDTKRLPPGRRYDGWIAFQAGNISARVMLTVQVTEPLMPGLLYARLRKSAFLGFYTSVSVALILLLSYFYPLKPVSLWLPAIQASTRPAPLTDGKFGIGNGWVGPKQNQDNFGGGTGQLLFSVYENGQLNLYVAQADGTQQHSLHVAGRSPAWSPDGQSIAFIAEQGGSPQIYVMDVSKRIPIQLTNSHESKSALAWSPDQQRLAFIAGKPEQGILKIVNIPDNAIRAWASQPLTLAHEQVENLNILVEASPAKQAPNKQVLGAVQNFSWSPDGKKLLFDVQNADKHVIFQAGADASQLFFDFDSWAPAWSPGGDWVVVTSKLGLYTVDAHGQNVQHLNAMHAWAPTWSPDGTLIAFLSDQDNQPGVADLWLTDTKGHYQARLTTSGCLSFAWSPLGDHLAYVTGNSDDPSHAFYLWLIQPGQPGQLIAEVGEPHISWQKIKSR